MKKNKLIDLEYVSRMQGKAMLLHIAFYRRNESVKQTLEDRRFVFFQNEHSLHLLFNI